MDPSQLMGGITSGGGMSGGSSEAGGNDSLVGGGNISFGVLPALPRLGGGVSVSGSVGSSAMIGLGVAAVVVAVAYFVMKKGR